jgi:glycosyltransferase involved in cell wall biosynthesis
MPDIVLTGTFGIGPSLSVVNKYGLSIAVFVRAFENFESFKNSDSRFKFFLKKMIYGDIGPSSLKKADYLLPNSRFMADVCRDLVPGVEQRVVYPALLYSDLEDIKIPRNPKNIFMVGSSEHKGFPVFQHLAENFPELDFHVLGDTDSSEGGSGKKENLIFHGWTDVVSILTKSADLLLVPSLCPEAFGRVAVEGLISGTPILVSNIGGLPEAVSFEKDLMVESGNKEAWRKAVSDFVNDPEKVCSATGRAQRNCGAFSLERQLFELEDFIVNVLG